MNNFFHFVLLISAGSCLLYIAYLLIRNHSTPTFNRYFLLSCILIPILFSTFTFKSTLAPTWLSYSQNRIYGSPKPYIHKVSVSEISEPATPIKATAAPSIAVNWWNFSESLYQIISGLLLVKILLAVISIWRLKKSARKIENPKPLWTVSRKGFTGASFFHLIFIHERFLSSASFPLLMAHESIHKKRWHSMDLMLAEINKALFWINPVAWLLVREIRVNAELETDVLLTKTVNVFEYSQLLIELSAPPQPILHPFSAFETKKRIALLIKPVTPKPLRMLWAIPFFVLSFLIISCQQEVDVFASLNPDESLKGVKTITSTYLSHQSDTQQKDGKTVAIAHYTLNGTLERVEQYMTFPYDYTDPKILNFYTEPSASGVTHIIDGLSLGKAENNLLYGHAWPKVYAEATKRDGARQETVYATYTTDVAWNTSGLPDHMTVDEHPKNKFIEYYKQRVTELFGYTSGKISTYSHQHTDIHTNADSISLEHHTRDDAALFYEGDHLKEVRQGENSYAFAYEGAFLTTTSFSINGQIYNSRKYYYDENGLKVKTEVLNANGEPEYTILFDYEFYDL